MRQGSPVGEGFFLHLAAFRGVDGDLITGLLDTSYMTQNIITVVRCYATSRHQSCQADGSDAL